MSSRQPSKESKQKWLEANKHKRPTINKASRLRTFYGISLDEYRDMIIKQDGKCAICKSPFSDEKAFLPHVDHDHSSGWVRGLTCQTCNSGLGQFNEDIGRMQSAIEYLISNAPPTEFNIGAARASCKFRSRWDNKERRAEYSENMRSKSAWNKGKSWSEDTKKKISQSMTISHKNRRGHV